MNLKFGEVARNIRGVIDSFSETSPAGIALFDLDGTLIGWDCQLLFRHFVIKREPWRGCFLPVFLLALPFMRLLGAGGMKRVFLSYLWKISEETLARHSQEFATAVMPQIYPELRERIARHRQLGHLLILTSASPEFYVVEIGRELGFDLALGTQVEPGGFFPDLDNHKGSAKVARLTELLPSSYFENGKLRHCHGYTDSRADLPLLGLCDEATLVNPSPAFTAMAASNGWQVVRPALPWKSRIDHAIQSFALLLGLGK